MLSVFADYFDVNRKRILRDFLLFYLFFLLAVIGASRFDLKALIYSPFIAFGIAIAVVSTLHVLAAWLIVWTAAKEKQISLGTYIGSSYYDPKMLIREAPKRR